MDAMVGKALIFVVNTQTYNQLGILGGIKPE